MMINEGGRGWYCKFPQRLKISLIGVLSDTLLCLEATQLERAGKLSNVFAAVPAKRHDVTSLMKQTLDPTLGED